MDPGVRRPQAPKQHTAGAGVGTPAVRGRCHRPGAVYHTLGSGRPSLTQADLSRSCEYDNMHLPQGVSAASEDEARVIERALRPLTGNGCTATTSPERRTVPLRRRPAS